MLDITKDIQSLTTFRRRSGDFMKQLSKSKRPVVLTVKGKAAAIVQDAEAYQRLLDIAARADAAEGIRQGLEDSKRGLGPDAERDLADIYRRIEARTSDAALTWYRGLRDAIRALRDNPNRSPATPEGR